ncbi:hypothetical protein TSOC111612_23825 [Tsukamurella ocularis]
MSITAVTSMPCGWAQPTGPLNWPRSSRPMQVPGGQVSDLSWFTTLPWTSRALPAPSDTWMPQRIVRSPDAHAFSPGASRPIWNRPFGSRRVPRYSVTTGGHSWSRCAAITDCVGYGAFSGSVRAGSPATSNLCGWRQSTGAIVVGSLSQVRHVPGLDRASVVPAAASRGAFSSFFGSNAPVKYRPAPSASAPTITAARTARTVRAPARPVVSAGTGWVSVSSAIALHHARSARGRVVGTAVGAARRCRNRLVG